jgi:hypothetical protein
LYKKNTFLPFTIIISGLFEKGKYFQRQKLCRQSQQSSYINQAEYSLLTFLYLYHNEKPHLKCKCCPTLRTKLRKKRDSLCTNLQWNLSILVQTSITTLFILKLPNIKSYEHSYSDCRQETPIKTEGRTDRNMNDGSEGIRTRLRRKQLLGFFYYRQNTTILTTERS